MQNVSGPFTVFSGVERLQSRIDDVIGLRVLEMNVVSASNGFIGSSLIKLKSSLLGSLLDQNTFHIGTAVDSNSTISTARSDVIGLGFSSGGNNDIFVNMNSFLPFAKPSPIEGFNWEIEEVVGSKSYAATYTIEFVIEFTHLCTCKPEFKRNESSLYTTNF